jgi:hypothetical protein
MPVSPSINELIQQTMEAAERLQRLVSEDRPHVVKSDRDQLCLVYWTLMFEHHYSILVLARSELNASAFALVRPFEEAFFLLFLVMHGTPKQFESIRNGTYQMDFASAGAQLDANLATGPTIVRKGASTQDWYKLRKNRLHGFTHGGLQQVVRHINGKDIVPNFQEQEVREMIETTMLHIHLAASIVTLFLGLTVENSVAVEAFKEYATCITT